MTRNFRVIWPNLAKAGEKQGREGEKKFNACENDVKSRGDNTNQRRTTNFQSPKLPADLAKSGGKQVKTCQKQENNKK